MTMTTAGILTAMPGLGQDPDEIREIDSPLHCSLVGVTELKERT